VTSVISPPSYRDPAANNESSEVIDILLPVTFYFNPSTRLDNVKNLRRFVISDPPGPEAVLVEQHTSQLCHFDSD